MSPVEPVAPAGASSPSADQADLGENPLALDRQVCFALSVASRGVIALYRPLLEPLNLTHPQYLVMLALWESDPRSVKDLSHTVQAEPATLSPLLKRLESVGYLTRSRSSGDERLVTVGLTPAGRDLRAEAEKIPQRIVERLGMPIGELESLNTALREVMAAAQKAKTAPAER